MAEFSEARDMTEQVAAEATARVTKANQNTLNFLFGANRLLLDEFVFAGNEFLERGRTETHLFTEFVSKMASVHSVKGVQEMVEGMRPAPDRFPPARQRAHLRPWSADGRRRPQAGNSATRGLSVFSVSQN